MLKQWLTGLNATDIIVFYAAIISTVALLWNVANAILEKTTRLKISIGIRIQFIGSPGLGLIDEPQYVLTIRIINLSLYDIYINKPALQALHLWVLPIKINGHDSFFVTNLRTEECYPRLLKPREQFVVDIEISHNVLEHFKKYNNQNKIRAKVTDTSGKTFYSSNTIMNYMILNTEKQ